MPHPAPQSCSATVVRPVSHERILQLWMHEKTNSTDTHSTYSAANTQTLQKRGKTLRCSWGFLKYLTEVWVNTPPPPPPPPRCKHWPQSNITAACQPRFLEQFQVFWWKHYTKVSQLECLPTENCSKGFLLLCQCTMLKTSLRSYSVVKGFVLISSTMYLILKNIIQKVRTLV